MNVLNKPFNEKKMPPHCNTYLCGDIQNNETILMQRPIVTCDNKTIFARPSEMVL